MHRWFAKQQGEKNGRDYYVLYEQGEGVQPFRVLWHTGGAVACPAWILGDEAEAGGTSGTARAVGDAAAPARAEAWQVYNPELGEWLLDEMKCVAGVAVLVVEDEPLAQAPA